MITNAILNGYNMWDSVSELSGLLSLSLHLKQHYQHNDAAAAREVSEPTVYLYSINVHKYT